MDKILFANKSSIVTNSVSVENQWRAEDANEVKSVVNPLVDYVNGLGWERYFDGTHTELSPQTLTAGIENLITIDGATSLVSQSPLDVGPMWSANTLNAVGLNDMLMIRIDFKGKISNADGSFEISMDIGGDVGLVFLKAERFRRGANIEQPFFFAVPIYTGSTFLENGGQIFINPSHTMEIYGKSILIQRTYIGR